MPPLAFSHLTSKGLRRLYVGKRDQEDLSPSFSFPSSACSTLKLYLELAHRLSLVDACILTLLQHEEHCPEQGWERDRRLQEKRQRTWWWLCSPLSVTQGQR